MKVLLTGANGMVGQNFMRHPGAQAYEILRPSRSELDLSSKDDVEAYLVKNRPEVVVHVAGKVGGIQDNIKNPVIFLTENIDINRNVIALSQKVGIKKLLNLGSSCMYPRQASNPLKEEMILQGELEPTNEGYALAKIMGQRLCTYIMNQDPSFQYKTLIPCNLYGPYDKFDPAHSHLVPAIIKKVDDANKLGLKSVEIWGDGEARREFMYVGDLVDAMFRCLSDFNSVPNLMNVGLGIDYSVNEYYAAAAEVLSYKGKFHHDTSKPVGMKRKLVSTETAEGWGWKSKTSLQDGIRKTYEYYKSTKN